MFHDSFPLCSIANLLIRRRVPNVLPANCAGTASTVCQNWHTAVVENYSTYCSSLKSDASRCAQAAENETKSPQFLVLSVFRNRKRKGIELQVLVAGDVETRHAGNARVILSIPADPSVRRLRKSSGPSAVPTGHLFRHGRHRGPLSGRRLRLEPDEYRLFL